MQIKKKNLKPNKQTNELPEYPWTLWHLKGTNINSTEFAERKERSKRTVTIYKETVAKILKLEKYKLTAPTILPKFK